MKTVQVPESWRDRALIVYDVEEPRRWFSAEELVTVDAMRLEKRRIEWMLSRIAEKELRRRGAQGAHVSFSHSGRFGAAAVDATPIGIDVETKRAINPGALHLFLTPDEEHAAARCAVADAFVHFWSAKEARWKQLGGSIPTLKGVPLNLIEATNAGLIFEGVETITTREVIAALTTVNRQPTTRA